MSAWRRIGWQRMEVLVPGDWYLTKIGTDPAQGDLWLADAEMPRLQIKWFDAAKQRSVNPIATLDRYLEQLEKQAKKKRLDFEAERDIKLVGRAGRDIGSFECFSWTSEVQAYGVIWYNREAQRVTLAQVNGEIGEEGLKSLARRVLGALNDSPQEALDLWTAYDLECRVPREFGLKAQTMETGHTELEFQRRRDTVTIARYGLASIALERAGDLGDWAHSRRFKSWVTFRLDREPGEIHGLSAVTFRGVKRSGLERFRSRLFNFLGRPYPIALSARVWHCPEANCLFLVEHLRDARSDDLLDLLCEHVPCLPEPVKPPK